MINCIPLIHYNCTVNVTEAKLNSRKLLHVCIITGAREQGVLRVLQHPLFFSVGNCKLL